MWQPCKFDYFQENVKKYSITLIFGHRLLLGFCHSTILHATVSIFDDSQSQRGGPFLCIQAKSTTKNKSEKKLAK